MFVRIGLLTLLLAALAPVSADSGKSATLPDNYCRWEVVDYAIEESLCGLNGDAQRGQKIVSDSHLGNCLACHYIEGGESPGTIAPPLVAMSSRYPDKAALRAQIWDATVANPDSSMPPFGRHGILSEEEIDKVTEFIWAL